MKENEGLLMRLGQGTVHGHNAATYVIYSMIMIGRKVIHRIIVSDKLGSYLDLGAPMTLYTANWMFFYNMLLGVRHLEGTLVKIGIFTLLYYIIGEFVISGIIILACYLVGRDLYNPAFLVIAGMLLAHCLGFMISAIRILFFVRQ